MLASVDLGVVFGCVTGEVSVTLASVVDFVTWLAFSECDNNDCSVGAGVFRSAFTSTEIAYKTSTFNLVQFKYI